MMITASDTVSDQAQHDGRFWVSETHKLDDDSVQVFAYLADKGLDTKAVMAQRAAAINLALASVPPPDPVLDAIVKAQGQYVGGDKAAAKQSLDFASAQIATAISVIPATLQPASGV